ncbi:MAG: hypothetical protein AAF734_06180 [Bacteroidota bacterium]
MKNKLNWHIYSHQERNAVINHLKAIISSADGYIISSNFFSDIAMNLTVEIEERNIKTLHYLLSQEMSISKFDVNTFDQASKKEWWIFLNINFGQGKGDLKINIPNVPG